MDQKELNCLKRAACQLRMDILEEVYEAQSGHPGGALSSAEILTWLYQKELRVDPAAPKDPARDRFVLSKGHSSPGLYAALAERGFFEREILKSFRAPGSILQGHPDMKKIPVWICLPEAWDRESARPAEWPWGPNFSGKATGPMYF